MSFERGLIFSFGFFSGCARRGPNFVEATSGLRLRKLGAVRIGAPNQNARYRNLETAVPAVKVQDRCRVVRHQHLNVIKRSEGTRV